MKITWKTKTRSILGRTGVERPRRSPGGKATLTLNANEVAALRELLGHAMYERVRNPISWLRRSKHDQKLLRELGGFCEGVTHLAISHTDDETRMSVDYRAAMRAVSPLGEELSRLEESGS